MEEKRQLPYWLVLMFILISVVLGLFISSAVGLGIASLLYSGEGDFVNAMNHPQKPGLIAPILVLQGTISIISFLLAPAYLWKFILKKKFSDLGISPVSVANTFLIFGIVITFALTDSIIIQWNNSIHLPAFLGEFENWARLKEDELAELTKAITQFNSPGEFWLALLIIAVVAGLTEETLFRGFIQTEIFRGTKNIHLAIWTSAFIFSSIHMQFFGFFPRLFLGALFGYLYYWSGNLVVPMFAHFVNNGFSVLMIYLFRQHVVETDLESPEALPWPAVITASIAFILLLYFFKKQFTSNPIRSDQEVQ